MKQISFFIFIISESAAYIRTEPKQKPQVEDSSNAEAIVSSSSQLDCHETEPIQSNNVVDYDQLRHYFKVWISLI